MMFNVSREEKVRLKIIWNLLYEITDEKSKRLLAAAMAKSFGHRGLGMVHGLTGMSKTSIKLGIDQLHENI